MQAKMTRILWMVILPDKIAEIEGVESAFGMMTRTAFSVEVNGNETEIDLFSHDKTLLDTFKKSVISGEYIKSL